MIEIILQRLERGRDGIFSELSGPEDFTAATLEHAYERSPGSRCYVPKIPAGRFRCVRGRHRLHGMADPFETFEVTGVEGHTNLLFHWGNYNADSEGCILVGRSIARGRGCTMIAQSRGAFADLMAHLGNVDAFWLYVLD